MSKKDLAPGGCGAFDALDPGWPALALLLSQGWGKYVACDFSRSSRVLSAYRGPAFSSLESTSARPHSRPARQENTLVPVWESCRSFSSEGCHKPSRETLPCWVWWNWRRSI